MSVSSIRVFSHLGMCVSDIERSKRFYCDGLGFKPGIAYKVGNDFGKVMEVEGEIVLNSVFIHRDGMNIELLGFDSPGHQGEAKRRPMNQLGLTHLSMLVDDVDQVAARAAEHGGTIVEKTRNTSEAGDFMFVLDPDGIRVELMRLEAGPVPTAE